MRRVFTAVLLLLTAPLAGCASFPDEGPVRDATSSATTAHDEGVPYAPPGPARGQGPAAVVRGFLDAMMANPAQTRTAREFLTARAAVRWHPERRVITYGGIVTPQGGSPITVRLPQAQVVSATGQWRGPLPSAERTLRLRMKLEYGEWRIAAVPDALLVHETWFAEHYAWRNLYFFDHDGETLVPEPVLVPRGRSGAAALVRGLVQGPPPGAPVGLTSAVPRSKAAFAFSGDAVSVSFARHSALSAEARERLADQLAWTLRQVPGVASVEVVTGSDAVKLSDGASRFDVGRGARLDPVGAHTSDVFIGLYGGRVVSVSGSLATPVRGPLGRGPALRDVSVNLSARVAAGVSRDGRRLWVAPVSTPGGRGLRRANLSAVDLARPAWDRADRLWLLDRHRGRAVVWLVPNGGVPRRVVVPGVTGTAARQLIVSPDGSRLVAVVRSGSRSQLLQARVGWGAGGVRIGSARVLAAPASGLILDMCWRSTTTVAVLGRVSQTLSEVQTIAVDGSPARLRNAARSELLRADVRGLICSAHARSAWFWTAGREALELAPVTGARGPDARVRVHYPG